MGDHKVETKAAVGVSEMARMVALSRARFYQLMKAGAFPPPEHDSDTGRPFYSEEQQRAVLDVRRRNCGVNGRPVLFYARRAGPTPPVRKRPAAGPGTPRPDPHAEVVEAVRALGLTGVAPAEVGRAVAEVYPQGAAGVDPGEVVRQVFLWMKRRNPAEKPGR